MLTVVIVQQVARRRRHSVLATLAFVFAVNKIVNFGGLTFNL